MSKPEPRPTENQPWDKIAGATIALYLLLGGGAFVALDLLTTDGLLHATVGAAIAGTYFAVMYTYQQSWRREMAIFGVPLATGLLASLTARGICTQIPAHETCTPRQMNGFTFANLYFPMIVIGITWAVRESTRLWKEKFHKNTKAKKDESHSNH